MNGFRSLLASLGLLLLSGAASADQGALPIRPGDTVRGTLRRCGERHALEVQLLRREVLRMRVVPEGQASVQVRVFDPEGYDVSGRARVRLSGSTLVLGPFRVVKSGSHTVEIATFSAHGTRYEATSGIRRKRGRSVLVGGSRRTRAVAVAAGSRVRLDVRRGDPSVSLTLPGAAREELRPGDARLAALLGGGLAAPTSGIYRIALDDRRSRVRVRVTPPVATAAELEFPRLPEGAPGTGSWYWSQRWVPSTRLETPDPTGHGAPPEHATDRHEAPDAHDGTPWSADALRGAADPAEPAPPASEAAWRLPTGLSDEQSWDGAFSRVGMPLAGFPPVEDALRNGEPVAAAGGPMYVCTAARAPFGEVTYRVQFLVDGIPSVAPMALQGRVAVRWTVTSPQPFHQGTWTLTTDPTHALVALEGQETCTDASLRTVRSAATGFTLSDRRAWPSGELSLSYVDAYGAGGAARTETFDGTEAVRVEVRSGETLRESVLPMTR
jgi:hypothetical protein